MVANQIANITETTMQINRQCDVMRRRRGTAELRCNMVWVGVAEAIVVSDFPTLP